MLLTPLAFLIFLGLTVWLIGEHFRYTGIAVIGSTFIIIAGSAIALTGIDIKTGQTTDFAYTEINNSTVQDSASVSYQYETTALSTILNIGIAAPLGLGGLMMLLGAVMMAQTLTGEVV